jgi:hypothetical protein
MSDETTRVDEWLYATLTADTALRNELGGAPPATRVFSDVAPQGTPSPWLVFSFVTADDTVGVNPGTRILVRGLWIVKGIARAESYLGALRTIADRIDAVLQAASGSTVSGVTVVLSHRVRPIRYAEVDDAGVQIRHLGGLYAVVAHAT